jgi:hypothetical protein
MELHLYESEKKQVHVCRERWETCKSNGEKHLKIDRDHMKFRNIEL